tara:strand:+ start:4334 stop:4660 length:327 start_codon:yes stop_codon:yes gene_type:complete
MPGETAAVMKYCAKCGTQGSEKTFWGKYCDGCMCFYGYQCDGRVCPIKDGGCGAVSMDQNGGGERFGYRCEMRRICQDCGITVEMGDWLEQIMGGICGRCYLGYEDQA